MKRAEFLYRGAFYVAEGGWSKVLRIRRGGHIVRKVSPSLARFAMEALREAIYDENRSDNAGSW